MSAGVSGAAIDTNRQLQREYGRQLQELLAGNTGPDRRAFTALQDQVEARFFP